jgi:UV DNA damage endonuclease
MDLQKQGRKFQTMTYKRFSSLDRQAAIKILSDRYKNNIITTSHIAVECAKNNWTYRISSDIFPLLTYKLANISWHELPNTNDLDFLLLNLNATIKSRSLRISCHPDQFNVLASENQDAVDRTIVELEHHAWLMTQLGTEKSHNFPINIHINATKGNTADIADRFAKNFDRLSDDVKSRLVIENEDKGIWNVKNICEYIQSRIKIPITFDYLHHECNSGGISQEDAFQMCIETWDTKPLFHYSESLPNQKNPRKHADFPIKRIEAYNRDIDVDMEFKMKDLAIRQYENLFLNMDDIYYG